MWLLIETVSLLISLKMSNIIFQLRGNAFSWPSAFVRCNYCFYKAATWKTYL